MKKIKFLLFIILVALAVFFSYRFDLREKKQSTRNVIQNVDKQDELDKISHQVDDTAIIKKVLKSVGIIGLLEGIEEYNQLLEDETWYSYRGIKIDWKYRFSIAVNYEDMEVDVQNNIVNIKINKDKMFIWFVEKTEASSSHSEASWLAKKFSSQEIETLEHAVMKKVVNKISNTPEYWEKAYKSLEENITRICNDLGFQNVRIESSES